MEKSFSNYYTGFLIRVINNTECIVHSLVILNKNAATFNYII